MATLEEAIDAIDRLSSSLSSVPDKMIVESHTVPADDILFFRATRALESIADSLADLARSRAV